MNNYNMIWENIIHIGLQVVPGITHLFVKNDMEKCLKISLEMKELKDLIACVLLMHMKKKIHHNMVMAEAVVVIHYHQIQQQKHSFCSVQPSISFVVVYNT